MGVIRMAVQQQDPLLDVEAAGAYLGRNVRFMRQMVAERKIEFVKVGGLLRFRRSVLDAYLAENTRRPVVLVRERAAKVAEPASQPRSRRRTAKASA
jgi:excisionase family DNA binding protein